jgi:hypothetical protein
LISTGSDSHAPNQPVDPLPYRAGWAKDLLARLGIDVQAENERDLHWHEGMSPKPAKVEPDKTEAPATADESVPDAKSSEE